MKIVYLNPGATIGGAERSLLDFLAAIRETDPSHELYLITGTDGPILAEAKALGVHAEVLPMPRHLAEFGDSTIAFPGGLRLFKAFNLAWRGVRGWLAARRYAYQLKARLLALSPDIVHSNGMKCHILSAMARLPKTPIVWHVHDFLSTRRIVSKALRWSSSAVSHAIANSLAVEADIRDLLPGVEASTIYYGVDLDYYTPGRGDGEKLDTLANFPPGPADMVRVGLIATYARWKGQDVFLDAVSRLRDIAGRSSVRFFIIGGPIYQTQGSQFSEDELRALAAKFHIADRVGFIPFQSDTASVYRALDVVVHASSKPEPFGRTIVEAMACGRAVIAMQAGGAAELFTHDVNALGAPPNDPIALSAAIRALTESSTKRQCLGNNARQNAVKYFSRTRLGPELLAIYQRLVSRRPM